MIGVFLHSIVIIYNLKVAQAGQSLGLSLQVLHPNLGGSFLQRLLRDFPPFFANHHIWIRRRYCENLAREHLQAGKHVELRFGAGVVRGLPERPERRLYWL